MFFRSPELQKNFTEFHAPEELHSPKGFYPHHLYPTPLCWAPLTCWISLSSVTLKYTISSSTFIVFLFVFFTTYQHTGYFSANCLLSFWVRPRTRQHCLAPTHSSALKKRLEIVPRYKIYTKNKIIVYSHTTLNTPDLIWPRKLSSVQPWLVLEWETITSFLRTLVLYDHTTKFQKLSSLEQYC